jgi:hypothetical protein
MNIFNEIAARENANDYRLGMPAANSAHFDRRMTAMAQLTNQKGFRLYPKQPKRDAQGLTRGDRRRLRHAAAFDKWKTAEAERIAKRAAQAEAINRMSDDMAKAKRGRRT